MPKYVCCFEEVRSIAENLVKSAEGYITISPITLDATDYTVLEKLMAQIAND